MTHGEDGLLSSQRKSGLRRYAAYWPILTFWLLVFALDKLDWTHGFVRAALLIGIAALAIRCVRARHHAAPAEPPRQIVVLLVTLVVVHVGYFVARMVSPGNMSDIAAMNLTGAQMMLHGENPYTADIDPFARLILGPALTPDLVGYKYFPVMMIVYAPLGPLLGKQGVLITNLVFELGTAALIFLAARRDGGRAAGAFAASIYLSLPLVLGVIYAKGVADSIPVALLLASLVASERRPFAAGLLLGLSSASKVLPGVAAGPACVPRHGRMIFVIGVIIGMVPILLAYLSAPDALIQNTLRFSMVRPMHSSSWMVHFDPATITSIRIVLTLVWGALAIATFWKATSLSIRSASAALMILVILVGGPVIPPNYLIWWIPFLCIPLGVEAAAIWQRQRSEN